MTPLKTKKKTKNKKQKQKSDVFGENFWKSILSYFPKVSSQIFVEFGQKWLILHDFSKLKKKKKKTLPIWKYLVGCARKTGFSFSMA